MTSELNNLTDKNFKRQFRRGFSLRTGMTLAMITTVTLASLAIGYFSFTRNRTTQTFLGNQFQTATRENAENQIQALMAQEALEINKFFLNIDKSVVATADYTANLLSQEISITDSAYWEANDKIFRLPNGGWDNSNNDLASIFAPNTFQLNDRSAKTANTLSYLDFIVPDLVDSDPNIVAIYFDNDDGYTYYYPNIDLANLVPADFDPTQRIWYTKAKNSLYKNTRVVWSEPYNDAAQQGLIVTNSIPIYDKNETFYGVIGADIKLEAITKQVLEIQIGETGYAFLSDTLGNILVMPELGYKNFGISPEKYLAEGSVELATLNQGPPYLQPVFNGMVRHVSGFARIKINDTEHYFAYSPIPSTGYSLAVIVPATEMESAYLESQALVARENQATTRFWLILLGVVVAAATIVSLVLSQVLTNPLNKLTETARQVSAGNLKARAPKTPVGEVNVLAEAFNIMTSQLREMLGGLEARVSERTAELEIAHQESQRRAAQFEAIAQVARGISASQDLETLLPRITEVISEHFGFYHVGIFLLDDEKEFAVLRAANSPGGQKMLAREHKLKVGETGIVGHATSRGKARIALDTGKDAVYFDNPDLPDTRSEMALPMIVGDQIIGALDVQSTEPNAFSREDIDTLSTLADQVAIAIQNARLYEETRTALAQSQALYQQFTQAGWRQFRKSQKWIGIRHSKQKAELITDPLSETAQKENGSLNLPINLRGQKIGELKIDANEKHKWNQDDIDIASAIIERAAIALENARLLEEAQRRAAREFATSEVANKISSSTNIDTILRSTVEELGRKIPGAQVAFEISSESQNQTVQE
jgi:GAF domain-containing protein/HAMP domain-containing protein